MASDNNSWIADTVADFIHSPIWGAPVQTFVEAHCATFDYDDDDDVTEEDDTARSSVEEQLHIHQRYQRLVDSLIKGLGADLGLDQGELAEVCQLPTPFDGAVIVDESYEQLYSARDFQLFQDMMKRKNLILQLQALVSLQLQWGLLKHSDTGDDLVLSLLLQATSSSSRRGSVNPPSEKAPTAKQQPQQNNDKYGQNHDDDDDDDDVVVIPQKPATVAAPSSSSSRKNKEKIEPKKPPKEEYRLPGLRRKGGLDHDAEWHRDLQRQDSKNDDDDDDDDSKENDQSKNLSTPQTIGTISEKVLRQKLRDLTERTTAGVDDESAAAIEVRKKFLQEQREKIVNEKRAERSRELEQQTPNIRPQSAAHIARKAMTTANESKQEEKPTQIPDDELSKRRAMMAKLKREVVDKR